MIRLSLSYLMILSTVLAGLIAGFFYTWSFTIVQSLNLSGDDTATAAMTVINANIRSGWFAAIFFGTPVLITISLISKLWRDKRSLYWQLIAFVSAWCTLLITFTQHIPLNNALAQGMPWSSYHLDWVSWNHVRLCTSLLAFIAMILACLKQTEPHIVSN